MLFIKLLPIQPLANKILCKQPLNPTGFGKVFFLNALVAEIFLQNTKICCIGPYTKQLGFKVFEIISLDSFEEFLRNED